ncbi:hypothetical protein H0H81_000149 [Sphagnurus paluster]|uniref:G domain-containing protein n=1 Tax=Sphagnurus paluster TaxID=117069 RepID=A0A9P7GKK5_9AGAR|nr:hypothetical protein H0H81_000149 [Sphagnurus paluster]
MAKTRLEETLVDNFMSDTRPTDLVIPIMGQTGSGKSSFVNVLVGKEVAKIGHETESETTLPQHYIIESLSSAERRVIVVDTLGFNDDVREDDEIVRRIGRWVAKSLKVPDDMKLAGVIYLHEITQARMPGTAMKNLEMFHTLCGPRATENTSLVTTKWNNLIAKDVGIAREKELKDIQWKKMLEKGSRVARLDPPDNTALKIIQLIISKEIIRQALQIQTELFQVDRHLTKTEAGQQLRYTLQELIESQKNMTENLEQAGEEVHQRIRMNDQSIQKALTELKKFQLSWTARFLRWLGLA